MLSYDEAITQILDKVGPLAPVALPLLQTLGLVLAEDVVAPHPLPPFTNSQMDGYAVRAEDVRAAASDHPVRLPVSGEIAAGTGDIQPLPPGTAMRIMTGAPLPLGADAVVPKEDTESVGNAVSIKAAVTPQQYVRRAGEDVQAGAVVLTADTVIRPAEIGMCAAVGRTAVPVTPRPNIAIISTGDELIAPGMLLRTGQIYNSNAYSLAAQVAEAGGEVMQQRHAADTAEAVREAFDACAAADVIITSGGVSVGEYDFVKSVFAERGTVDFWRVAIRPGKPLAFGTWGHRLFFGLPGNPVSSMVTFELFVRPALLKLRGLRDLSRTVVQAELTENASHEPGRRDYQRALVTREGDLYYARPTGSQGSGMLRSMVLANALLIIPDDVAVIPVGATASVLLLGNSLVI